MKTNSLFRAALSGLLIAILAHLPLLAQTPSTPGQPLSVDTSSRVKRDFKIPSAKTLTFESGATFKLDDGTVFNIGSTAAADLRTAIGDLNATKVFTNSANRGTSVPAFVGQLGFQLDSETFYYGTATTAGQWSSHFNMDWLSGGYLSINNSDGGEAANFEGQAGVANFTRSATTADAAVFVNNAAGTGPALRLEGTAGDMLQIRNETATVTATIDRSGLILAGSGTAGAPGFSFYGDADTGIYRSGANTVAVAVNGSLMASVSSSGLSVSGPIAGTTGTFSGALSGTTGTFSGALSGASATLTAPLPVASGGTGAATATAARSALGMDIAIFSDTKANRTLADTITSGAWRKLTLNTEDADTAGGFSVSSSVITVGAAGAGTWLVRAAVPFYATDYTTVRLRRTSGTPATIAVGQTGYYWSAGYTVTNNVMVQTVTLTAGDTLELQAYTQTSGSVGFGTTSLGNADEVSKYSVISFERQ